MKSQAWQVSKVKKRVGSYEVLWNIWVNVLEYVEPKITLNLLCLQKWLMYYCLKIATFPFLKTVQKHLFAWDQAASVLLLQSCPTLQPHRPQPTRLLCPWYFPSESTEVGCHALPQGSSQPRDQPLMSPASPALQVFSLPLGHQESPWSCWNPP